MAKNKKVIIHYDKPVINSGQFKAEKNKNLNHVMSEHFLSSSNKSEKKKSDNANIKKPKPLKAGQKKENHDKQIKSVKAKNSNNKKKGASFIKKSVWNKEFKNLLVVSLVGSYIAFLAFFIYSQYHDISKATIIETITYQGKITDTDGIAPDNDDYNMRFSIYDAETGGNLLWQEVWDTDPSSSQVTITNGVFSVELNSHCDSWVTLAGSGGCAYTVDDVDGVDWATEAGGYYLEVEADLNQTPGDGPLSDGYEEVFSPRKRFTSVPYAMNADSLDGFDSAEFVISSGLTTSGAKKVGDLVAENFYEQSLIAQYEFAIDGSGADSGPNDLDGTAQNSGNISDGVYNLNGSSEYLTIPDDDLLSFGDSTDDSAFSLSAWVYMNDATNFQIINKRNASQGQEWYLTLNADDKLIFALYDHENNDDPPVTGAIGRRSINALTDYENQWVLITVTYDGSEVSDNMKFYLNSVELTTESADNGNSYTSMENGGGAVYAGRYGSIYANGKMDDIRIYSKELVIDEIRDLVNNSPVYNLYGSQLNFTALDDTDGDDIDDTLEGGYLAWDKVHNRFKFDQEVYAPEMIPYFNNALGDRDYTYLADNDKLLAYDFHTSSGDTADDLVGTVDSTIFGNADWTNNGYIGYGIKVNQEDSGITFGDPGFAANDAEGTVELWVRLNDISASGVNNYIFRLAEAVNQDIILRKTVPDQLSFSLGSAGFTNVGWQFPDNNWHHIVFSWDSGDVIVYADNQKFTFNSVYTPSDFNAANFTTNYLGTSMSTTTQALNGSIDSFAIYDDLLTDEEVNIHYHAAFNNLYVNNNLSDGNITADLADFWSIPYSLNDNNNIDPVYQYDDKKAVALAFSEGYGSSSTENGGAVPTDANMYGDIAWTKKGYYGYALDFDGSDDYLQIADHNFIDFADTEHISIEFWIKGYDDGQTGADNQNSRIISKYDDSTDDGIGYEVYFNTNDELVFAVNDTGAAEGVETITTTGTDLSDGEWHHITIQFNNNASSNTVMIFEGSNTTPIGYDDTLSAVGDLSNSEDLYIGSQAGSDYFFQGVIDSLIIYKDRLINPYDNFSRDTLGQDVLVVNSHAISDNSQGPLAAINQSTTGYGGIFALADENYYDTANDNTAGYPLGVWNDFQDSASDIYNLIYFGTSTLSGSQTNFGNLQYYDDETDNYFVLSDSLKIENGLAWPTRNYFTWYEERIVDADDSDGDDPWDTADYINTGGLVAGDQGFRMMHDGVIRGISATIENSFSGTEPTVLIYIDGVDTGYDGLELEGTGTGDYDLLGGAGDDEDITFEAGEHIQLYTSAGSSLTDAQDGNVTIILEVELDE